MKMLEEEVSMDGTFSDAKASLAHITHYPLPLPLPLPIIRPSVGWSAGY